VVRIAPFPVPPVVKTATVICPPARGFALFAEDFGRWWPLGREPILGPTRSIVQSNRVSAGACSNAPAMGAKPPGGRFWRTSRDTGLAFSWVVELSADQEQLVEIRFTPEGSGTRVELTHSGWEKLGEAAANLRQRYDRGWATVFERHFAEYANGPQSELRR
jgi:uncharacterized protein YndB with AHSA1/START domain